MKRSCLAWAALQVAALTAGAMVIPALAGDESDGFYKNKTVYMVVGSTPGGGFDTYGRLVARYMSRYLPGHPSIVVENYDGAGGANAASRVSTTSPQDGTYIGAIHAETILDPLIGDPHKKTMPLNVAYIGSADTDFETCFVRTDAPVKKLSDAYKTDLVLGAGTDASSTREYALILKNVLGLKIKVVAGYPGNAQIILAVDRGEVQGMCGASYTAITSIRPDWFKQNKVRVLAQETVDPDPTLTAAGVPRTYDLATTDEQKDILKLFYSQEVFGRPFVVGRNVPKPQIEMMRSAFMRTLADADLLTDAKKMGLEIAPLSGPKLDELVAQVYSSSPDVLKKTRAALGY